MTLLRHYPDATDPKRFVEHRDADAIANTLATVGVAFRRWDASQPVVAGDPPDKVLAAYAAQIDELKAARGFATCDVISMAPDHPEKTAFRKKFLDEHTHSEDEARFFVDGVGLFNIHGNGEVFALRAEKGDLVNVPAGTKHWFDMGPEPRFVAIRFFTDKAGWVANYTGDTIASRYPELERTESISPDEDVITQIGAPPRQQR
jgi:1,2-dihydroxy-3-keto-5-methylthiopentene dioxygenase